MCAIGLANLWFGNLIRVRCDFCLQGAASSGVIGCVLILSMQFVMLIMAAQCVHYFCFFNTSRFLLTRRASVGHEYIFRYL